MKVLVCTETPEEPATQPEDGALTPEDIGKWKKRFQCNENCEHTFSSDNSLMITGTPSRV